MRRSVWHKGAVRLLVPLLLTCVGCQDPPRQPAAPAPPPPAPAPDAAAVAPAPALTPTAPPPPALAAAQAHARAELYRRQGEVPLPEALPEALRAAIPPTDRKVVVMQRTRQMRQSKPAADARRSMVRLLTLHRGAALDTWLRASLARGSWVVAGAPLVGTHDRGERGRLTVRITEAPEEPTAIELVLDDADPGTPLAAPATLLPVAPAWLSALKIPVVGFEVGRFHGRRPGVHSTDVDRLALAVRAPDSEATRAAVEAAALAAGYTRDAKKPHLLRHPDRITLAWKVEGETLVLHHQRRWRRPDAPPGESGRADR